MPRPHLDEAIFQCYQDIGGSAVWTSSYHLNDEQWWVGWHTTSPFRRWFSGQGTWTLIGYEKWRHWSHGHLTEAYYAEPNPSLTPGPDLTPVGHWRVAYDHQGELIEEAYSEKPLGWDEEGAFLNCNWKGVGNAFPNMLQGKGKKGMRKGNNGKGRSKGKNGRSKGKEQMKGEGTGKGKGQNGNDSNDSEVQRWEQWEQ